MAENKKIAGASPEGGSTSTRSVEERLGAPVSSGKRVMTGVPVLDRMLAQGVPRESLGKHPFIEGDGHVETIVETRGD